MSKVDRMYANSPKLERNESGKMTVMQKKSSEVNSGTDGMPMTEEHQGHMHERMMMHHKHMHEKMMMHEKHEMAHRHHGGGEKEKMHEKHEGEYADMHKRHHDEMKHMHSRHEKESHEGMAESKPKMEKKMESAADETGE